MCLTGQANEQARARRSLAGSVRGWLETPPGPCSRDGCQRDLLVWTWEARQLWPWTPPPAGRGGWPGSGSVSARPLQTCCHYFAEAASGKPLGKEKMDMCSGLALLKATPLNFIWFISVTQKCLNNSLDYYFFSNEVINGIMPIRAKATLSLH